MIAHIHYYDTDGSYHRESGTFDEETITKFVADVESAGGTVIEIERVEQ